MLGNIVSKSVFTVGVSLSLLCYHNIKSFMG